MKLYTCTCPKCNAGLKISRKTKEITCDYCGQSFLLEDVEVVDDDGKHSSRDLKVAIEIAMVCSCVLSIIFMCAASPYLFLVFGLIALVLGIIELRKKKLIGLIGVITGGIVVIILVCGIFMVLGAIGTSPRLTFPIESLQNPENFNNITEDDVIDILRNVPGVIDVAAVNSSNDPNGLLKKDDGYISEVYFSVEGLDLPAIQDMEIIKGGIHLGGCIELFRNEQDAEKRVQYLDKWGFLGSGGHGHIGNTVIRTTDVLTPTKQQELADRIVKMIDAR